MGFGGNFDVKITIDKAYTIGGTGYLQNKNEIGHSYQRYGAASCCIQRKPTFDLAFLCAKRTWFCLGSG